MAGEIPDLIAQERTGTGKGAARQARRDGMVPGVVYGGGSDPVSIQIPFNDLLKRLKAGRFVSTLFNLKVDGHDDVRVICRDVQRDVVKDLPTHLDLMRLRRASKVNLFIAVDFINEAEAPGLKKGGVLTVVRPEIELIVTASEIPESITVENKITPILKYFFIDYFFPVLPNPPCPRAVSDNSGTISKLIGPPSMDTN